MRLSRLLDVFINNKQSLCRQKKTGGAAYLSLTVAQLLLFLPNDTFNHNIRANELQQKKGAPSLCEGLWLFFQP